MTMTLPQFVSSFADDGEQAALLLQLLARLDTDLQAPLAVSLFNMGRGWWLNAAGVDVGKVRQIAVNLAAAGLPERTAYNEAVLIAAGLRTP
jgi:hypothetical protein